MTRTTAAWSAGILATVTDEAGQPLANAVVSIVAMAPGAAIAPAAGLLRAEIDQRNEDFLPPVVVIQRGGSVVFRNSDRTRHHIYSFSAAKQFEIVQTPDDVSAPVRFDIAGTVAIGCNIHDHMIAHVYVTDAQGRAEIGDLPVGAFTVTVWHARLRPRAAPPSQMVALDNGASSLAMTVPVLPARRARDPNSSPY